VLLSSVILLTSGCSREARRDRHLSRGTRYFEAHQYYPAVIEYVNVLRLDPTNATAIRNTGLALFELGRSADAFQFLTRSVQMEPTNAEVTHKLAAIYLWGGLQKKARDLALTLATNQPPDFDSLLIVADASMSKEELDQVRQLLMQHASEWDTRAVFHIALGNIAVRSKDLDSAEKEFRRALTVDGKSSEAHEALALIFRLRGDTAQAEKEYETAAGLAPMDSSGRLKWASYEVGVGKTDRGLEILKEVNEKAPAYLPAWMLRAEIMFTQKKFDECLAAIARILKAEPGHADARLLRGRVWVAEGQPDKAVKEYLDIVRAYPKSPRPHYYLALAYIQQRNTGAALRELSDVIQLDPGNPDAVLLSAEINVRAGQPDAAIDALEKLTAQHSDLAVAYVLLGDAYRAKKMPEKAIGAYRKVSTLAPKNADGPYLIGSVLQGEGKASEAKAAFEQALVLAPDHFLALSSIASMDVARGDSDRAIARIRKQIEVAPKSAGFWFLLGQTLAAKGDTGGAEVALRKTIDLEPRFAGAYSSLARIYVQGGRTNDALKKVEEGLAVDSNHVQSLMLAGMIQEQKGDVEKARQAYERILSVNPHFAPAANNLACLYSEKLGDKTKAFDLAQRAHEDAPGDSFIGDTLGWILCQRGENKWAATLLEESAKQLPNSPEAQYHLGMNRLALGNETGAQTAFTAAVALGKDFSGIADAKAFVSLLAVDPDHPLDAAAVSAVTACLQKTPDNPAALLRQGALDEQTGKFEDARKDYEHVIAANPSYAPALLRLAELLGGQFKEPKKALELAKKAREIAGTADSRVTATLAWAAFLSGDHKWAASLSEESAKSLPDDSRIQYRYGVSCYAVGKLVEATQAVARALALSPSDVVREDAVVFLDMACSSASAAPSPDALSRARQVIGKNRDCLPASMVVALGIQSSGDAAGARSAYEDILARYPEFTPAMRRLLSLYAASDMVSGEALQLAARARDLMPGDSEVAAAAGKIACVGGKYGWAAQMLQERVTQRPDDSESFYYLGVAQQQLKQKDAARESLSKALALNPNGAKAEESRKRLAELAPKK